MPEYRNKIGRVSAAAILACGLSAGAASAVTVSGTTITGINDGAEIDGTRSDDQSLFSQEFAISTDTASFMGATYSFGTITFGDIPVIDDQFQFIFDSQETGGDPEMQIDDIILVSGGAVLWDYDQLTFGSLMLDGTTASPRGNGADMGLYVDVSVFAGLGLTGADTLEFYWLQSDDDNGPDEWVAVGDGFYGADDPIGGPAPVPLPASILLLGGALFGFRAVRRKA